MSDVRLLPKGDSIVTNHDELCEKVLPDNIHDTHRFIIACREQLKEALKSGLLCDGNHEKNKPDIVLQVIRETNVGDDVIIHNEHGMVWCILRVMSKEHKEQADGH